ncbi:copper chaperone PCu(A)C [Acidocella sp.]|uniref:copper chaperone PCu(A)C n=1 Tax=Acidocella sp. TaxID=50710 RepID=UPI00262667F0|nr:copper chaperone PCu(A)C [Acidocella sp.]
MKFYLPALLLGGFALATPASADVIISLDHGAVWETGQSLKATEGFIEIHNKGASPDVMTGWDCPLAKSTTLLNAQGEAVTSLAIPAGQTVTLSPASLHLSLQTLSYPVAYGSVIPCSFTFQTAGSVGGYLNAEPAPASP